MNPVWNVILCVEYITRRQFTLQTYMIPLGSKGYEFSGIRLFLQDAYSMRQQQQQSMR